MVFAPLLSLLLFTLGSGFLTTLLTIRLHLQGGSSWVVGFLTAAYYAGLVLGSFVIGRTTKRVGHIRVYAASAAILSVAILLQGLIAVDWFWILLRFITGAFTAALYVAIESWMLVVSPPERRGQMLSLYMIVFYAALALGQFLLNINNISSVIPFCIVVLFCSLSIFPITITHATSPKFEDIAPLSLIKIFRISPSGMLACLAAGLITSVVYGVLPLFAGENGLSSAFTAQIMSATIFGAMAIQYPLGKLSDWIERRKVLIICSLVSCFLAVLLMFMTHHHELFLFCAFMFGGFSFIIYPLGINHTCDFLDGDNLVAVTQGLLLANGIGSIVGPLIVPSMMHLFGPLGIFAYFAIITFALGIFFYWRRSITSPTPIEEQHEFVAATRTTSLTSSLVSKDQQALHS